MLLSLLFTFSPFKGPKEWKFPDPDTGRVFIAQSKPELIQRVVAYRAQNNLDEIENLGLVIDHYLCLQKENLGACHPTDPMERGVIATVKGAFTLFRSLMYKTFASQEEADRRALICIKCPYNTFPDKTEFVEWSDKLAVKTIGKRKSSFHDQLGNCALCTCPLKCKVFYKGKVTLDEDQMRQMSEVGCWQPGLL